jgi:hypothetical protein
MKCAHTFAASGKCAKCGKRKPGRPKVSTKPPTVAETAVASMAASETPALPPPVSPGRPGLPDRAERLAVLFAPPAAPPAAPANDNDGDEEPAAKPRGKKSRVGWPWIAKRASTVVDVAAGAAINHWTDREANDAGEVELEEFETALADYGEDTFGKVEAPAWIVLLLALAFLVLSKYIGAARKPKPEPKPAPIPAPAPAVATSAQDAVSAVTPNETAPILSTMDPTIPDEKGAGNAENAEVGF